MDVAHVFRERDNVILKQQLIKTDRDATLAQELITNPLLRAIISIIDDEKQSTDMTGEWCEGVLVTHALIRSHIGNHKLVPIDWCRRVTPFLQQLGLDVLLFNDDSGIPMFVRWYKLEDRELEGRIEDYTRRGWEHFNRTNPAPRLWSQQQPRAP